MSLSTLELLAIVACPNCISSVGGSGTAYMWATVAMLAVPAGIGGAFWWLLRPAR